MILGRVGSREERSTRPIALGKQPSPTSVVTAKRAARAEVAQAEMPQNAAQRVTGIDGRL
jgi:hypothetical protein